MTHPIFASKERLVIISVDPRLSNCQLILYWLRFPKGVSKKLQIHHDGKTAILQDGMTDSVIEAVTIDIVVVHHRPKLGDAVGFPTMIGA